MATFRVVIFCAAVNNKKAYLWHDIKVIFALSTAVMLSAAAVFAASIVFPVVMAMMITFCIRIIAEIPCN